MIIRIKNGATTQTLAAGDARVVGQPLGPVGLSLSGPVDVQSRKFLRGPAAKFSSRGNKQTLLGFSVYYEFGSIELAQAFIMSWRETVLREGTIEMVSEAGAVNSIANAVLIDPAITQITGVSVRVDYIIQGGAESYAAEPAAPAAAVDADGEAMFDSDGEEMIFQA